MSGMLALALRCTRRRSKRRGTSGTNHARERKSVEPMAAITATLLGLFRTRHGKGVIISRDEQSERGHVADR
jgi:hypothetical protein